MRKSEGKATSVFVSYSHRDKRWLERLQVHLKPLVREGEIDLWDDTRIRPGAHWKAEIDRALAAARVAVFLVSADFLASDFIHAEELPVLLEAAERRGARLLSVILGHCLYAGSPLVRFQAINSPDEPLDGLPETEREKVLRDLALAIAAQMPADAADTVSKGLVPMSPTGDGEELGHAAIPKSECTDPAVQALSDQLHAARDEQDQLICEGADTAEVQARIIELRRRLREGGRLRAGDFVLDGRYKLIKQLKQGGFGTIFRAFDKGRRRLVAIKALHGQYADDRSRVERFFRGARKMAELHHQGIVQVLDPRQVDEGHYFFVMEYLSGGDLRDAVLNKLPTPGWVLELVLKVGAALAFAHARDMIHRDVKPANIVLDADGQPKLTDFDLVRAGDTTGGTRTGALGTFGYAAPEAMQRPQDADARADVYGLGMTAVFALHGSETHPIEIWRDAEGFVDRLPIPAAVKPVLAHAIALEKEDRYESIEAFCEGLRQARGQAELKSAPSRSVADTEPPTHPDTTPAAATDARSCTGDDGSGAGRTATRGDQSPQRVIGEEGVAPSRRISFSDRFTDGSGDAPEMIWLPGGTFRMGSPEGVGQDDERPAHDVTLSHYAVGKFPVTVGEFRRFVEATGYKTDAERGDGARVWNSGKPEEKKDANWRKPYMKQDDRHPVVCISWNDAKAYCAWLSKETGQSYGLLSEAQWEYACRAGSETPWCFGDDEKALEEYAWFGDASVSGSTHAVGGKQPNAWDLHDMHGNVWEWCEDWFAEDYYKQFARSTGESARGIGVNASGAAVDASSATNGASKNPSGPEAGSLRVVRGGSWDYVADYCRSAYRYRNGPSYRDLNLGFRLSRTGPWRSYPITLGGAQRDDEESPQPGLTDPAQRGSSKPRRVSEPTVEPFKGFRDRLVILAKGDKRQEIDAPEMVYLPGGTFRMGDEQGQNDEKPVHLVRLDAFAIGRTPVTWGDYRRFCEAADSHWPEWLKEGSSYHLDSGTDKYYPNRGIKRDALDLPVVGISRDDVRAYCEWLSELTGKPYRLPTEAQWEFACRAGTETRWSCGDDEQDLDGYAWYSGNSQGRLHPVAKKRPNPWGLYDMHGNCWEWCADWYARDYYAQLASAFEQHASGARKTSSGAPVAASANPSGPEAGSRRVVRGGSWDCGAGLCRSACRAGGGPSGRDSGLGFRLSRTV